MKHVTIILAALLMVGCSTSTYRQNADGSFTYHVGNLADKTDYDLSAAIGQGTAPATISRPVPLFDPEGNIVAVGQTAMTFPGGTILRIQEGRDGTEVPKDVSRGFFAWQSLKSWVAGDVAKTREVETTARTGIEASAGVETERLRQVGSSAGAITNPESGETGVRTMGQLLRR